MQDGIFQKSIVKKTCRLEKFLKLIKRAVCNKAVQVGFAACLFDTPLLKIEITLEGGVENKQTNF